MITSITLKDVASYQEQDQILNNLTSLNFIYGENGCGKSTIARLLDCKFNGTGNKESFARCNVCTGWSQHENRKFFIYDTDFVKKLLGEQTLDGVFVMGEDAPELEKERLDSEKLLAQKIAEREHLKDKLIEFKEEVDAEEKNFKELIWTKGKRFRDDFKEAYAGCSRKESFKEKCLEFFKDETPIHSFEELKKSAEFYFSDKGQPLEKDKIPILEWDDLTALNGFPIFKTEITGKEDTSVAKLITLLGNNDWVDNGRTFFDGKTCPFCQQTTPTSLSSDLEMYFDETYSKQKEELATNTYNYLEDVAALKFRIQDIARHRDEFFHHTEVEKLASWAEGFLDENCNNLKIKEKEPSNIVTISIEFVENLLQKIVEIINQSNARIDEYNATVRSFESGKKLLKKNVWRYVSRELSTDYTEFQKKISSSEKGMVGVRRGIQAKNAEIKTLTGKIKKIGEKLKNIAKPAKDINSLLKAFGFFNFYLREEGEEARYSIVRDGGESANKTLSEGEKTFIAFLYFYEMVKGVDPQKNIFEDKIIVLDDPVSSLDSKVLYAVSALIKELSVNRNSFKIHQIFLLTHNVYFFKEVTNMRPSKNDKPTFWIIRKAAGQSYIEGRNENPIRTSYQMLWDEVRMAAQYPDLDIRNTLRRIIEHYFGMFGGRDKWDLLTHFEGDDKFVCESLFQWTNDGSHSIFDDIFISQDNTVKENYLRVFKAIFNESGHGAHYTMMTRTEKEEVVIPDRAVGGN